jgi:hypothetical protein
LREGQYNVKKTNLLPHGNADLPPQVGNRGHKSKTERQKNSRLAIPNKQWERQNIIKSGRQGKTPAKQRRPIDGPFITMNNISRNRHIPDLIGTMECNIIIIEMRTPHY